MLPMRFCALSRRVSAAFLLLIMSNGHGAPGDTVGVEFVVNMTPGSGAPAMAVDALGNSIIAAWHQTAASGSTDIRVRRYGADGMPIGGEVLVTSTAGGRMPSVALDPAGNFVVVWQAPDAYGDGVFARIYSSDGLPRGGAFQVNGYTAYDQRAAKVAMDAAGNFVVAWESDVQDGNGSGIFARRYAADGTARGSEVQVNSGPNDYENQAAIAMNPAGAFVITWNCTDYPYDSGMAKGICGQLYNADGSTRGWLFRVNSYTNDQQWSSSVAMDEAGNFVIAWQSYTQEPYPDHNGWGIYAQRFSSTGSRIGAEFLVNTTTAKHQYDPAVAMDADGDFTVLWKGQSADGADYNIYGQSYAADGSRRGGEFKVNTVVSGEQSLPSIAMDADGDWAGAWLSADDPGGNLVRAARFKGPQDVDLAVSVTDSMDPVDEGGTYQYFADVSNVSAVQTTGVGAANGVALDLALPGEVTVTSVSGDAWNCSSAPNNIANCVLSGALAAGTQAPRIFAELTAPTVPGVVEAHANVRGNQDDTNTANNSDSESTGAYDMTPDALAFVALSDVTRSTMQTSESVAIGGVDTSVRISVANGTYSLNGGAFTATAGTAVAGDVVQLRHTSSASFDSTVTTTLSVGRSSAIFSSTTYARDSSPDPFSFPDQANVPQNTHVISEPVTITGINDFTRIAIDPDSYYSIDGRPFTNTVGNVANGQSVRVSHNAGGFSDVVTSTLTVGDHSATFTTTAEARDANPDPFGFAGQINVPSNTLVASDEATITGINDFADVSVSNGEYSVNGGFYTAAVGRVVNGARIRVRHNSGSFSQTTITTLTIGGVSGTFTTQAEPEDQTPDAFDFVDVTGAKALSTVRSNVVTIAGINTPVNVTLSGNAVCYINRIYSGTSGTVQSGDTLQLEAKAGLLPGQKVTATATIGTSADTWSVRTYSILPPLR